MLLPSRDLHAFYRLNLSADKLIKQSLPDLEPLSPGRPPIVRAGPGWLTARVPIRALPAAAHLSLQEHSHPAPHDRSSIQGASASPESPVPPAGTSPPRQLQPRCGTSRALPGNLTTSKSRHSSPPATIRREAPSTILPASSAPGAALSPPRHPEWTSAGASRSASQPGRQQSASVA